MERHGSRAAALACLFALAWTSSAAAGDANAEKSRPIECAPGMEPYLPGDYYFCAGYRALARGRDRTAIGLFESAASWGDKRAQFNLGLLYYRGEHVRQDQALGLAWLALSAERPQDSLQREVLESAYAAASPELRRQADALWNEMKPRYADATARKRALTRFARNTRHLERATRFSSSDTVWIDGLGSSAIKPMLDFLGRTADTSLGRTAPGGSVTLGAPEPLPDAPPAP